MTFNYEQALTSRRNSTPSRAYLWCVELPNLDDAPLGGESPSMNKARQTIRSSGEYVPNLDMKTINTLVTGINTPFHSFDTDKVTEGNKFWHRPKHMDISSITITMEEQANGIVWQYLNNWKSLITHPNGGYNPPHFFKRDILFHRLDLGKSIFQTFVYRNFFLSEISSISNDYNTNSPLEYSATLVGDGMFERFTAKGDHLKEILEKATRHLGETDITYDPLSGFSIPPDAVTSVLTEVGRRAL